VLTNTAAGLEPVHARQVAAHENDSITRLPEEILGKIVRNYLDRLFSVGRPLEAVGVQLYFDLEDDLQVLDFFELVMDNQHLLVCDPTIRAEHPEGLGLLLLLKLREFEARELSLEPSQLGLIYGIEVLLSNLCLVQLRQVRALADLTLTQSLLNELRGRQLQNLQSLRIPLCGDEVEHSRRFQGHLLLLQLRSALSVRVPEATVI